MIFQVLNKPQFSQTYLEEKIETKSSKMSVINRHQSLQTINEVNFDLLFLMHFPAHNYGKLHLDFRCTHFQFYQ